MFIRFESAVPSASGRYPGVFALANGLARDGLLTDEEHEWLVGNNDWFEHAYTDPGLTDPLIFDRAVHPHTACWFKQESAGHLLERLTGYLALLDKYGVGWVRLLSEDPERIVYADDVQIVVWLDA